MRLSIILLLCLLALALAQEILVEEEEETETAASTTVADDHDDDDDEGKLDLDELLLEEEDPAVVDDETVSKDSAVQEEEQAGSAEQKEHEQKVMEQTGPFVDLLGHQLYSLEMIDETQAQLVPQYTNDALKGKKVVGLYFSADWCGPCRKFTPELVSFYDKINSRRGRKDEFEIVWVSRCRDVQSYGQYFTHMKWLALPPEEAMGQRGQMLGDKYKVKSIPSLVLLDDLGNVITIDARNKIPQDKAGIGFPWRNPLAQLYITILPRSLRLMVKGQVDAVKGKLVQRLKGLVGRSA